MKSLKNLRVGKKFIVVFGGITIIMVLGLGYGIYNAYSIFRETERMYTLSLLSMEFLIEADRDAYQASVAASQAINRLNARTGAVPKGDKDYEKDIFEVRSNTEQVKQRFDKFRALYMQRGREASEYFPVFDREYDAILKLTDVIERRIAGRAAGDLESAYFTEYLPVFARMRNSMDKLTDQSLGYAKTEYEEARAGYRQVLINSLVLLTVMVIIFIGAGTVLTRMITRPASMSGRLAERMSEGDFTQKITLDQRDEFGRMTDSLNSFVERMRESISNIARVADEVGSTSQQMSATAVSFAENAQDQASSVEEITATIEEMASSMDGIARLSDEELQNLIRLSDGFLHLSDTIHTMEENTRAVLSMSETIAGSARLGESALQKMNGTMTNITKSSDDMTGIVKIISDISDQINLLSLNAAIEAARAGEAGRGFAVVADEISKLADETASSLKEIGRHIDRNNGEVKNGMSTIIETTSLMQNVIEGINQIVAKINEVARTMKEQIEINHQVEVQTDTVKNRAEEIKSATDEQKLAMIEITKSIDGINQLTTHNASGAEQLAGSSEHVTSSIAALRGTISFFKVKTEVM
ncbi:MAG: methyl-accepting chemotaxis protein [Spirochaetes bacterium]|nr:MAG: methyl-accepting chemotaxis protein [Spirochaetota bacterium]